jgi:hypothetical protein
VLPRVNEEEEDEEELEKKEKEDDDEEEEGEEKLEKKEKDDDDEDEEEEANWGKLTVKLTLMARVDARLMAPNDRSLGWIHLGSGTNFGSRSEGKHTKIKQRCLQGEGGKAGPFQS